MKLLLIPVLFILLDAKSCSEQQTPGLPKCIEQMITDFKNGPVQNPPASIYEYDYEGKKVYYVAPPCCDQLAKLYDADCNFLCSPDGGFTGKGDGKCPEFHSVKKNERLIWKDERMQ